MSGIRLPLKSEFVKMLLNPGHGGDDYVHYFICLVNFSLIFLIFPLGFLILVIFSYLNYNYLLHLRNLQEQVKKTFCFKNCTACINSHSRLEQFLKHKTNLSTLNVIIGTANYQSTEHLKFTGWHSFDH